MLTFDPILLSALNRSCPNASANLTAQLAQRGFATVTTDDPHIHRLLESGLDEAAEMSGFRFPPHDSETENAIYTPTKRAVFKTLFYISLACFESLSRGSVIPPTLTTALDNVHQAHFSLFGTDGQDHEPFGNGQPFAQSFFNLFNYNQGLLNPHYDRSLMTIVKVRAGGNLQDNQTSLWAKSNTGEWTNVDRTVGPDEVVVMIGQESEALSFARASNLYAAEHAVRVEPKGEYIPHSHFQRDPQTPTQRNRVSAAFILRHDESG